jgi:hypothetical protein
MELGTCAGNNVNESNTDNDYPNAVAELIALNHTYLELTERLIDKAEQALARNRFVIHGNV